MKHLVNGEEVDMTPEQEAEFLATLPALTMPSEPPVSLQEFAGARLQVDQENWDVPGVDRSRGISAAFLMDTDEVWVFWETPQPDLDYVVTPSEGVTKYLEYVKVSRPALAEIMFIAQRVQ